MKLQFVWMLFQLEYLKSKDPGLLSDLIERSASEKEFFIRKVIE